MMAETCWLVAVVIVLWTLGLVCIIAAIVEFMIWVRAKGLSPNGVSKGIRASPAIAMVWFVIGMSVLLLLYLVATEQLS